MMQRFSSNCNENMVSPCYSCGYFHHGGQANCNSFSMLFSMQNHHIPPQSYEDVDHNMYGYSSSSPSVDCTLSLGPPSSRFTHENEKSSNRRKGNCMQNFCNWDILQSNNNSSSSPSSTNKSHRGGGRSNTNNGADPLLARRCTNCDTTSTPLWRNGPRGPKSLCNACGIRYKKEERRATAAAATTRGGAAAAVDTQHIINGPSSWMHHSGYGNNNEFRFIQEDDGGYVFPLLASQHY